MSWSATGGLLLLILILTFWLFITASEVRHLRSENLERIETLRQHRDELDAWKKDVKDLQAAASISADRYNKDHEELKNLGTRLSALGAEMGYDWSPQTTWAHWKKREK